MIKQHVISELKSDRSIIRRLREKYQRSIFKKVISEPFGLIGFLIVVIVIFSAIFAPQISPYPPNKIDISNRFSGPTSRHFLGTDQLGRDLFSRLIFGSRIAIIVAFPAVGISLAIGLILGMLAGYLSGHIESILVAVFDIIRSFPSLILALAMIALLGPSLSNLIFIIAFTWFPGYARVARAQTLKLKTIDYVEAERAIGASTVRIMLRHVLPNILGPLIILASMDIPVVITFEAGLSFLGLGVRPPTADWGAILSDGYSYIRVSPWIVIFSGLALIIATLGFTLFGETLRDVLDPKLRKVRR